MIPSLSAFPMINNVHVRGMSYLGERQIIRPSWKDVIGVGANWISFSTYSHTQLVPDVAPIGGFRDHTSTVLLSPAIDFSNVITQMDYRQHSILAGLASVGGVFTVVDGIFAMLFGTTLFTLILGTKHISPFGSLGILVREKLRRAIQEQYPALQSELQGGGMATFLRDVSVDLRILADPLAGSASSYSEISPKQRESSLAGDELELDTLYDAPGTYDTDKTLTPDYADVLLEPAHARQRDSHRASNASVDGLYRG
ncbi:hypothetical protein JAAARDRAFT_477922 [Jaapia argillacea MUCL 33604]|uniref:Uncharacterized protein n=1 Tax=Jaapia argillacea MUCL 33604 TaxID=933084 RepID=A0A067PQA5_9AGAM|nr:hypothetical protein JAAARDRAFT_477922 [Jaapia argillacea MUCL 33604]